MLLAEVYERAGAIARIEPPFYVPDWHLHRDAERYMEGLLEYARPIEAPLAGDIALFRFGRTFSHGAIVTDWPRLVHAYWNIGVVHGDATLHPLAARPVRFFTPFLDEKENTSPQRTQRQREGTRRRISRSKTIASSAHPLRPLR